ncbi:GNAT family N-acetyltransferase [Candidatus Bathyarchaeota archaeon]|nr:MAG: GNAT family N-acetyltransferase [Candidatus Bathyarchaeota archaeon]
MSKGLVVRRALITDAQGVDNLLSEWFDWKPISGRLNSVRRAVRKKELIIAEAGSRVVGFIHYVMHEDIIDGGPNTFISAFYVSEGERGKGVGSLLLERAITDSLARGAVGVETSTIQMRARQLYERHHFKQTMGDIGEVFLELDIAEYLQTKESRK